MGRKRGNGKQEGEWRVGEGMGRSRSRRKNQDVIPLLQKL